MVDSFRRNERKKERTPVQFPNDICENTAFLDRGRDTYTHAQCARLSPIKFLRIVCGKSVVAQDYAGPYRNALADLYLAQVIVDCVFRLKFQPIFFFILFFLSLSLSFLIFFRSERRWPKRENCIGEIEVCGVERASSHLTRTRMHCERSENACSFYERSRISSERITIYEKKKQFMHKIEKEVRSQATLVLTCTFTKNPSNL